MWAVLVTSLILTAAPASSPADIEASVGQEILRSFEKIGRTAPRVDPALSRAARRLAESALKEGVERAADLLTLTHAVSIEGASDPSPRALLIRTSPPAQLLETIRARDDLAADPASHVGTGVAVQGDRAALVVLLTQRIARLDAFPRTIARVGEAKTLCGELASGWSRPELFVTRPTGAVDKLPPSRVQGRSFCALLPFPKAGTHTLEVLARGPAGPSVAALFLIEVGTSAPRAAKEQLPEPATLPLARVAILERVNALRRAHGLVPVEADPALDRVAQAYSERMKREGFFAHTAPDGSELSHRLKSAGYRYKSAGENLGLASGPLAAHFGVEHSPGHRKNLIDPAHRRLGLGIVEQDVRGRRQVLVTEILASPSAAGGDPLSEALRTIQQKRSAHALPPLKPDPTLSQIATDHVRRALKANAAKTELADSRVHERVFAALPQVKSAAVELYVADDPGQVPDSAALADPRNALVGVGLVRGDSKSHGSDRLWMVVIYAASSPRR